MENFNSTKRNINPLVLDSVEENTTFYYSNFKLFPDDSELLFASYLSFKKNLQSSLGEDWESYAKKSVYNKVEGSNIFIQSREIFSTALEVWLELRKKINSNQGEGQNADDNLILKEAPNDITNKSNKNDFEEERDDEKENNHKEGPRDTQRIEEEKKANDEDSMKNYEKESTQGSESGNEDMRGFEVFHQTVRAKFTENQINEAFFKALIQAFYVSAMKVWKTTLASYSVNPAFGGENASFLAESKRFFLNKLQTVYKTKFKMLKPILVATERVRDFIYKDSARQMQPVLDENDRKNINNFSSNLQFENPVHYNIPITLPELKVDEDRDLKLDFNNLRINSNDSNSLLGKRSAMQAHSVVEIKKMNKKFEKLLNQNTIEFAAHYVNNLTRNSVLDWQISRSFVTSMVEVNYNKLLQMENKLNTKASNVKNEIRIRFIQPAQDFYNRLMEVWIIFKTRSLNHEVLFTEYLDKVKNSLGNLWNEKFLTPTHNFFMTLYYEWHHLKQIENDTEEKVLLFTKKVKESMLKTWEDNIIKKAEELTGKSGANRQ